MIHGPWAWCVAGTIAMLAAPASLETPYAAVGEATVTPDTARALGRDVAAAIRRYLTEHQE